MDVLQQFFFLKSMKSTDLMQITPEHFIQSASFRTATYNVEYPSRRPAYDFRTTIIRVIRSMVS